MIDPVIEEVSRYISYYYGSKTRKEMMAFYESIIGRLEDETARKLLTDWYVLYYSRLSDNMGQEDVYRFNYNFMKRISAQANNRLATLINAKGPNFQMNAACSSTSNAITIAEDFIQSGRVKRMIIVGADDATSKGNLPLLGAGFLSTGAATNEGDLYRAALPFDRRRNGMIMSAGAVGLVLETKTEIDKRGVIEVCELLGTHSFNTATHPSQIDANQFANELDKFVGRMEQEHGLQRDQVARDAIYISHETYTPPRGGCSQTEAEALRRAFGEDYRSIIVGNTKGMTGHAMGASFEDAVAAKSLQYGRIPPVVNCSEPDPMLEGLNLSRGGFHDRSFALKMSAGFGSQGHFALLKKSASGDHRIRDAARHRAWVKGVASNEHPTTDYVGRLYVVKENGAALKRPVGTPASQEQSTMLTAEPRTPKLTAPRTVEVSKDKLSDRVVELISELTAYPPEMLEPDMEFEADLGIGQDIRADIVTALTELHALPEKAIQLSGDSTIGDLVERVLVLAGTDATNEAAIPRTAAAASASEPPFDKESIRTETLRVFSEVTKYPRDMLELEMEMEADLGIDTVKQATILSILGETYQLERDEDLQLSDYPTIGHIVDLVYERAGGHAQPGSTGTTGVYAIEIESALDVKEAIEAETLRVFAEVTKYPEDMLELDMEMEADLGIDTVKQATILSILGETYQLERDEDLQLSDYPTIGHIVDLVYERGRGVEKRPTETREAEEVITSYQPEPLPALDRTTLSRQVTVLNEVDLGPKDFDLQDKTVWILGDDKAPVSKLATACQQKNAHVVSFVFPRSTSAQDVEAAAKDLASNTAADAIIDCTHIGHLVHFDQLSADEARELLFMSSEARFALYKHLSSSMKHPTKILCLTAMDGCVGAGSSDRPFTDPTYGALSGFYKGLRKEWLDSDVRIIDFAPQAVEDQLETCIGQVLAEIEHSGTGVEIAYPDARRAIVCIEDEETQAVRELSLGEGDTLLSIGGGTGIASGILLALAERYPISFNIVGTVPLPEDVASLAQLDDEGLGQLKQDLRESLERKHAKLKPVMLKRAYERITKAIQVYRNIERMKSFGRQVVYTACDVRDYEKLEQSLNRARETLGPITAVLYAAGIDRSHLLDQKDVQEFHDVFTIKAQGVYNLMHLCQDDPLKLIVAMSSIAGRFGNAGQLDYCAANSFLSDWVKMMCHSRPGLHAISLVWSGWRDLGIAWRNELVRERSEELGLNLIEVDQGVAACLLEIEHVSEDREVILHRGLDGFLERGLAAVHLPDYPLVDRLTKKDGRIDRTYRVFSVKRDALIDQHRLGPVPILPAVAYSELAAEYYALQAGPADQYVLRDVSFANAFKLFHDEARELFVEGRPVNGEQAWEINVRSIFRPPMGQEAQIVHHSQSTVSSQLDDHHDMHPQNWTYDQAEPIVLPVETSLQLLQGSGPGQRIILGPLYNDVLRESRLREPVLVYPRGVTYPTYFPQEQLTNDKYPLEHLLINPCFLDSIYQACAASLLVNKERVYLPWEVKELGIVRVPRQEGLYTTYAQVVESHDDIVGFDVAMVDGDGRTCYYARNARFRMINL
jgi:3-oxoacyl-(acyl-carrier-protein) synthase/NAD(P)-dependent dehydrogenase (short-subunit alcohol dehydrogenase family)/acyl carrier protein